MGTHFQPEVDEPLRLQAAVLELIGEAVIVADLTGTIVFWNAASTRLTGWSRDEAVGGPVDRVLPPLSDLAAWVERHASALADGSPVKREVTARRQDGTAFPAELTLAPLRSGTGALVAAISVVRDLTALYAARDEERRRTAFLEAQLEGSQDGIVLILDQRVVAVNAAFEVLIAPASLVVGKPLDEALDAVRARFVPGDFTLTARTLEGEAGNAPRDKRTVGGRILSRWTRSVRTATGEIGRLSFYRDVTEERRRQRALEALELRWRTLFERMPDGMGLIQDGRYVIANDALARLLGRRRGAEVAGLDVETLYGPANVEKVRARSKALLRADGAEVPPTEYRIPTPDGTDRFVESASIRIDYEGRPAILTVVRDVGERRQLQAQLMLADRMVSVGTLAAGVAHELNNPLAFVLSNLRFAIEELRAAGGATEVLEALDDAVDGASRMTAIVRDLKGFSRVDDATPQPIDLHAGIEAAISIAFNQIKHRARLVRAFGPVPPVVGCPGRISQVVLNLLVNAAQAIPEGRFEDHEIRVETGTTAEGQARVRVSDTGCGIEPEALARVFEPFFTTKPVGVGTGLGLPVCQSILQAMGGAIVVSSIPGQGTTFEVRLPASPAAPAVEGGPAPANPFPERPVRLLVVDDEPQIREVLQRMLGGFHQVVTASGGSEALALLSADPCFEVILCDVMMPGLDGLEFWDRLREQSPPLAERLLFMSGGTFGQATQERLRALTTPPLSKPFDEEALRTSIQRAAGGTHLAS